MCIKYTCLILDKAYFILQCKYFWIGYSFKFSKVSDLFIPGTKKTIPYKLPFVRKSIFTFIKFRNRFYII